MRTVDVSDELDLGIALAELATDQAEWSQATFGSDAERGPIGALKHLEKEAREAQAAWELVVPGVDWGESFRSELADCFLLLLDASRRAGLSPMSLIQAAQAKMKVNRVRTWPKSKPGEPCEHVRG